MSREDKPITEPVYVKLREGDYEDSLSIDELWRFDNAVGSMNAFVVFDLDKNGRLLGVEIMPVEEK